MFEGCIIVDWVKNKFELKKYEEHNKIIANHSVRFYFKYYQDVNEKSHYPTTHRDALIKTHKKEKG